MEKSDWPPSGPMSMVFTQLLFINFCKDETVQLRWDGPKFDELLQQMHMHVPSIESQKTEKEPIPTKLENEEKNINGGKLSETDKTANDGHGSNSKKQISSKEKQPSMTVTAHKKEEKNEPEIKETSEPASGIVVDLKENDTNTNKMADERNVPEENSQANKTKRSELERANINYDSNVVEEDSTVSKKSELVRANNKRPMTDQINATATKKYEQERAKNNRPTVGQNSEKSNVAKQSNDGSKYPFSRDQNQPKPFIVHDPPPMVMNEPPPPSPPSPTSAPQKSSQQSPPQKSSQRSPPQNNQDPPKKSSTCALL